MKVREPGEMQRRLKAEIDRMAEVRRRGEDKAEESFTEWAKDKGLDISPLKTADLKIKKQVVERYTVEIDNSSVMWVLDRILVMGKHGYYLVSRRPVVDPRIESPFSAFERQRITFERIVEENDDVADEVRSCFKKA